MAAVEAFRTSYWLARRERRPAYDGPLPPEADMVIVGGGIAGTCLAASLATRGCKPVLLEAGLLGQAASGRNAGFLLAEGPQCFGEVARRGGEARAGLLRNLGLASRAALERLGLTQDGACEWERVGSLRLTADPLEAADFRASRHVPGLRFVSADALPAPWRGGPWLAGLCDEGDAVVHPLLLVEAAARTAAASGGFIREACPATALEPENGQWLVRTAAGDIRTPSVVLATSWSLPSLLRGAPLPGDLGAHLGGLRPARAQMLAARIEPAPPMGNPVYARHGRDYWRTLPSGTLLLGGCRDVGGAAEDTADPAPSAAVQRALDALLAEITPGARRRKVIHRWAGTMALTDDGLPRVGPVPGPAGRYVLAALQGHGMGWAPGLADALAAELCGATGEIPAALRPTLNPNEADRLRE